MRVIDRTLRRHRRVVRRTAPWLALVFAVLAPSPGRAQASEARPLPVEVIVLRPTPLVETLATTGTVRADERVDVVAEITGVAREIRFEEGRPVDRDAVLVVIDDTRLLAERDRVRYRLDLATARETRQKELLDQGIISQQDYDFAASDLGALRAELRIVESQLDKTRVRAPFAGVIGLRDVSEGALLSPQTRIATLHDLDPVKLDFTLPERHVGAVPPGAEVRFRVRGVEGTRRATVYAVEPRVDPETRSVTLRARCPNPDGALLPGAFADVEVPIDEKLDALVVPSMAVVPELGGKKVFVEVDGRVESRPVRTGIRTARTVELVAGVAPGDRVVVSAIQSLRDGIAVAPTVVTADGPPR